MHATNDAGSTMVLVKKTCGSLGERQFEQVGLKLERGDVEQPNVRKFNSFMVFVTHSAFKNDTLLLTTTLLRV